MVVRVPDAFVPMAPIPVDGHAEPSPLLGSVRLLFAHGRFSKGIKRWDYSRRRGWPPHLATLAVIAIISIGVYK